ncbi:MAG: LiaF-related protein [Prolixibacteraceae bacterium]|jgi:predicted membrane protein|nr:LiaF-related protein [Prolixibacteraceae bacterium]
MEKKHNSNGSRFFIGFILLFIGLVMILERAGVLNWEIYDFLLSWKMLLVAIGAFVFFNGNKGAGIVVMGVGTFFMLPDIFEDYEQIRRYFWPSLLLVMGLLLILSNNRKKKLKETGWSYKKDNSHANKGSSHAYSYTEADGDAKTEAHYYSKTGTDSDFFDEFVIFGGREINMVSSNLRGGHSTAIFGGAEVDLRKCTLAPEGCAIEVTTMFGGNVIKVPNDWTVLNKVTTIFGGYSDQRVKDPSYAPNPAKTIVLTGVCIFGGTEVRNYDKVH